MSLREDRRSSGMTSCDKDVFTTGRGRDRESLVCFERSFWLIPTDAKGTSLSDTIALIPAGRLVEQDPVMTRGSKMAKIQTTYNDGWPLMEPLGKKEAANLAQQLVANETILGQVIGNFGQAVVATTLKIVIVKSGLMSGQTFGGKATTFDYRNIVGIEVRSGLVQGEFEILAGGLGNNQQSTLRAKVNMAEQPNGLVFAKTDAPAFNALAGKIRERTTAAHAPVAPVAPESSAADEIAKFAALHAQGILTDEEWATKKAELLSRL